MNTKTWIILAVVATCVAVVGVATWQLSGGVSVETAVVKRDALHEYVVESAHASLLCAGHD